MDQVLTKTPAQLAPDINREYDQVQTNAYNAVVHAINCGGLLTKAKDALPHGEWEAWIEENFDGSQQTANVYMRLHANHGGSGDLPASISQAIRSLMPSEPKEKPLEPQSEAGKNLLANLNGSEPDHGSLDQTPPTWMPERVQRKWHSCLDFTTSLAEQLHVSDDLSETSCASTFREASKRARSLAVELEALAEAVERAAA